MGKSSIPSWRLEVEQVKIKGRTRFLWKAVDDAGEILDLYATEAPDEAVARQFLEKAMKAYGR